MTDGNLNFFRKYDDGENKRACSQVAWLAIIERKLPQFQFGITETLAYETMQSMMLRMAFFWLSNLD